MRPRQEAFRFDDADETSVPLLYLACRLTGLSENERRLLDSWCTHVTEAVAECTDEGEQPWKVRVHAALNWSPPWSDDRDAEEIYDLNSRNVAGCSAVVVLCIDGGGLGVGQEFTWATALRLPVLVLHPRGVAVSRQALGTPGDVTVVEFDTASELTDAVRAFLRQNRLVIEDWERRSDGLAIVLASLQQTFAELWAALGAEGQARVEAESRVHRRRIVQLANEPKAIAGASLSEILALAGALGMSISSVFAGPYLPEIGEYQRDALALAAEEMEWSAREVLALEDRARLELAPGGTRRFTLANPGDWIAFRERTNRS